VKPKIQEYHVDASTGQTGAWCPACSGWVDKPAEQGLPNPEELLRRAQAGDPLDDVPPGVRLELARLGKARLLARARQYAAHNEKKRLLAQRRKKERHARRR
jgi:hypothetical protein